jgi:hypothetical protein
LLLSSICIILCAFSPQQTIYPVCLAHSEPSIMVDVDVVASVMTNRTGSDFDVAIIHYLDTFAVLNLQKDRVIFEFSKFRAG